MPASAAKRVRYQSTVVYPETDHMGEHEIQRLIAELLRPMLARYLAERGVDAHAGADTFLYYVKGDPGARVAPDVYVLPDVPQASVAPAYKMWEVSPPSFALEVVTSDALKDYVDNPIAYSMLGAKELVLFDPEARATSKRRKRFTVYRRTAEGLLLAEETNGDRVRSRALGCYLRAVGAGHQLRVRLGLGPRGDELYPTEGEQAREHERSKLAADAEIARLRAELEALKKRR